MDKLIKIKLKIAALLSKTVDNGATKAEAESALAKANELMKRYLISSEQNKQEEACFLLHVPFIESSYNFGYFYNSLSTLFDCEYYYQTKKGIWFYGYKYDVELCKYFYELITRACYNDMQQYKKSKEYKQAREFHHGKSLISSFIKGWLVNISALMHYMFIDKFGMEKSASALMIQKKQSKVHQLFKDQFSDVKSVKIKRGVGIDLALKKGMKDADDFKFTLGIESS